MLRKNSAQTSHLKFFDKCVKSQKKPGSTFSGEKKSKIFGASEFLTIVKRLVALKLNPNVAEIVSFLWKCKCSALHRRL